MFELFVENRAAIQQLAVLLLFVIAWVKGTGPERASAAVLLGMVLIHIAFRDVGAVDAVFMTLDPVGFLIDTGGLAAFFWIGIRANRFYPLVLAAAQLVSFLAHLVRMLVEPISSLAYYLLAAVPFWFQLFVLAGGVVHHAYRVSRIGSYPAWRPSAAPARTTSFS